jgi:dienelactone hydrolase
VPDEKAMRGLGPVIACYGARDKTMRKMPDQLRARLAAVGQNDSQVLVFDAGHSFLTDGKPHLIQKVMPMGFGDHPEVREEAWGKIFEFFNLRL